MSQQFAKVQFNENGTPVSEQFDDIYFSNADGLKECHYVFLQHNQLPERWLDWPVDKPFHIAETGFGTGLNFLATWSAWLASGAADKGIKLIFTTFEKYPLAKSDLITAHQVWSEVAELASELTSQYPEYIESDSSFVLANGLVELNIVFGDVNERIQTIKPEHKINAWYLDGFAPSKNPDMWTQHLFDYMARLASTNCSVATFTAAGFVRRGLIEAGFTMKKDKGFGVKREMIFGHLDSVQVNNND